MRLMPLLMQLLMGMSMSRYLPAIGTAGLLRSIVSGYRRVPRPPPRIRLSTFRMSLVHKQGRGCRVRLGVVYHTGCGEVQGELMNCSGLLPPLPGAPGRGE